ncbi:hypothetical protein HCN44_003232 [Aphidius gifuensis]|uniref:Venom protein n=1 Tax=Aphidius gifuensis TaxID=684658 RepID=A0A835CNV6_APHGI|nr:uncharacterized protein LOC122859096 [Aphidius gifuensis]KAF7987470.1 hypothetical protein HCN44_003232 [Aphidius gifuensis]
MIKFVINILIICLINETIGVPTIYKRNEDNIFEPVMVPVSSTVIPLSDYKVGYGFGFFSKNKKAQSSYKPEGQVKLITVKKRRD